jgi:hypothetical protein
MPLEHLAAGGPPWEDSWAGDVTGTKADVHDMPALTRVSYVMVLMVKLPMNIIDDELEGRGVVSSYNSISSVPSAIRISAEGMREYSVVGCYQTLNVARWWWRKE